MIVLCIMFIDIDNWVGIAMFANEYQDYLRKYIELKKGK